MAAESTPPLPSPRRDWGQLLEATRISAASISHALYDRLFPFQADACSKCRGAFTPDIFDMPSEDAMSATQGARCHGCRITGYILRILHPFLEAKWGPSLTFSSIFSEPFQERSLIDLEVKDGQGRSHKESLEIFKLTTEPGHLTRRVDWARTACGFPRQIRHLPVYINMSSEQRPISGYTGSPDAFKLAFSWFQNCKANHDTSGDGAKPPILPTRVVNFSNKDNLQLVESQGARGQYLCLSHRWLRDNEMFRCTHDNITQLKQHIEWDSLTRTFQQAITFAQAFATWHCKTYSNHEPIRYIWIDSICIMQDSPEDWAKEAGLMCSVYENATLTIASAVGGNGCFAVADQVFKGFEITSPRHLRTQLYLRRPLPHFDLGFISIMARISRDEEPQSNSLDLLTRGWVLQERLLSKRFLIFGPHELLWECLRTVDCECGFLTNQSNTNALGESPTAKYLKAAYERSQKENPNNLLFPTPLKIGHYKSLLDAGGRQKHSQRWWQRVVEVYTRTNLTKASDRLPALAGLAKQFSRINSGQRYLAGMWEEMLIESLTWFVEETAEKPRVSTSSVTSDSLISVPSWSWASCGRPVQFMIQGVKLTKLYASLNDVAYAAASADNPFGNCSYGTLFLRGPVYWGLTKFFRNDGVGRLFPKCTYYSDKGDQPTDAQPNHGKYILIFRSDKVGDSSQLTTGWFFLHLRPIDEGPETNFQRLGLLLIETEIQEASQYAEITEAAIAACFEKGEVQLIQLT